MDSDSARVSNYGELSSGNWGICIAGNGSGRSVVHNSGTIDGWPAVGSNGTERFDLIDTGRIEALNQAFSGSDIGQCNVRNYGIMIGEGMIGDLDDSPVNRGFNDGKIWMGDGNDTVTVRGIVGDIIMLGTGNDDYCGTQSPFPISG